MIYDANGNERRPMTPLDRNVLWLVILYAVMWLLLLAFGAFAQNIQLSSGPVLLTSPATISPDSQRAVYADAAGLWSAPLKGGAPTPLVALPVGRQLFGAARITPQSDFVVYISDQDNLGKPELYSVPIAGGSSVRISKYMAATGQVRDYAIGQSQVYYAADTVTNNTMELWRVPVAGGPSVRVNRTFPSTGYDVFEYAVSTPPERVVYRVGRSDISNHKLWSAPATGTSAQSVEISRDMVTGGAVNEFAISPDGTRVAYRADALDNGRFDLWSVPITGGSSTRLDRNDGRSVRGDFLVDDSGVRYSYSATEWWSVSITGGAAIPIPPPMPEPVRSPDGQWIVYGAGVGLWSSHTNGDHQLVSCAGQSVTSTFVGKPTYSVSQDSRTVLYVGDGALWSGPVSGSVCELFRNGFESGTAGAWIVVE